MNDPVLAQRLLWARRGTAYFARKLSELRDEEFDEPTRLPGWTRRHLIAHVGYNARAIARLVEWAATGVETPMYSSPQARAEEIEKGATLRPFALRALAEHAAVHLNVLWRDLPAERWSEKVRTAQGRIVPASETPWMRAREVWIHAVDLDNGASFHDFEPELLDALLADVTGLWQRKQQGPSLVLRPTDRESAEYRVEVEGSAPRAVRGSTADLVRWVTGRGAVELEADGGELPRLGRWL
ncbi:maleylpyruvate isomerase family mycothiol-dependent enzyme [Saccharopolyspora rectivirgula]|uniref:maleylpyruvate isomerase family mycothiol-dependent enzyme n=1 Tax=Saccharopolyspora rectivirgula TaxID=28042 RepID=UPI0024096BB5|nr:maleylpyruvate isomerase family mycothiol-dependent enzyme [Saccharopolyspora rectivirgula]